MTTLMSGLSLLDSLMEDPSSQFGEGVSKEVEIDLVDDLDNFDFVNNNNNNKMDILSASLAQNGISSVMSEEEKLGSWDSETDALLDSILTGSDGGKLVLGLESDASSDSGCNLLTQDEFASSPEERPGSIDLIGYISNDAEDEDKPLLQAVDPMTNSPPVGGGGGGGGGGENDPLNAGGTTTIILPVISSVRQTVNLKTDEDSNSEPVSKRRRISASSSSDSGVDESSASSVATSPPPQKYPPLELTSEEKRLCEREGIKLPSHYPLSREEEKNLKRIRRKIRNKESAQHSRKRKKEYVDSMEDRVRMCTKENAELKSKIELLETQNKTLAGQLRRLHQIIVNGGLRQNQTSTAMMVLLLSTALFLIPGLQKQTETKPELDISQAVKVPPMPGQSRSLLQFAPTTIKQEYPEQNINSEAMVNVQNEADNTASNNNNNNSGGRSVLGKRQLPYSDHDYLSTTNGFDHSGGGGEILSKTVASSKLGSYIEDDAPPLGYGPEVEDRRLNVSVSHTAVRTVVLHVPKDIK